MVSRIFCSPPLTLVFVHPQFVDRTKDGNFYLTYGSREFFPGGPVVDGIQSQLKATATKDFAALNEQEKKYAKEQSRLTCIVVGHDYYCISYALE